jgi:hypothetical protein
VDGAEKEVKKRVENRGPKRVLNCKKANKIGVSRAMVGNDAPGNHSKAGPKSPYIWAIKNLKHGKRASQVRDGLNTVRDFEVLISLGPEIAQALKIRKYHFSKAPFWRIFKPFLTLFALQGTCG